MKLCLGGVSHESEAVLFSLSGLGLFSQSVSFALLLPSSVNFTSPLLISGKPRQTTDETICARACARVHACAHSWRTRGSRNYVCLMTLRCRSIRGDKVGAVKQKEKKKFSSLEVSSWLGGFLSWTSQNNNKYAANVDLESQLLPDPTAGLGSWRGAAPSGAPLM